MVSKGNEIFINESITRGIIDYLNNNKESLSFECQIIYLLVNIYGETSIINSYKLNDKNKVLDALCTYGLNKKEAQIFFNRIDNYSKNNDIPSLLDIGKILVKIITLKSKYKNLSEEEIKNYDNFINKNFNMYSEIITLWNHKKFLFNKDNKIELEEIKPVLLNQKLYNKYGLDIKDVVKFTNYRIRDINNQIIEKEKKNNKKEKPKDIYLTSGNTFVDTLILLSIIFTEIMAGLIIAICGG